MDRKKSAAILISAATLLSGVICFLLLPDSVAVQWSAAGEVSNYLPKGFAIIVSWGLTALMIFLSYAKNNKLYMFLSLIGIASQLLFVILN